LNENKTNSEYYTINEVDGVKVVTLKSNKFNIKKVTNIDKPQCLIVDEGTHLSNLEIQILAAWCETNNVTLHILGDRKQNGFSKIGNNIDREVCFMIRTPNLGVSFRDNNIQHYTNLTKLGTWLDYYESLSDDSPDYSKLIS
jgi:hypothetical protein